MNFTPVARITFGLVLLTIGILLAGNLLGFTPDNTQVALDARQRFCESLAVQSSVALRDNNLPLVTHTIETIVERDPEILSAALRKSDGSLITQTADHQLYWQAEETDRSTTTQVQVPIFRNSDRWGTVEIRFKPLAAEGLWGTLSTPFVQLLIFVGLSGYTVYYLLIKKVLKHLDPSSVIPGRVKAALDVLAEGVVLIDNRGNIVLANAAFAKELGVAAQNLLGTHLSHLHWTQPKTDEALQQFPWEASIQDAQNRTSIPICLTTRNSGKRTLMVNSAPILDGNGKPRGALTTFNDVTQLEQKNAQLEDMLQLLQDSQDKVNQQNEELQILASRDPLTDCLNRRALFEMIDREIETSHISGESLSCIMCDIDHFKKINDTYGHIQGDEVIRRTAETLKSLIRETDAVGRYGGEEFCILLPGMPLEKATQIAERFRSRIHDLDVNGVNVTASFGVATLDHDERSAQQLLQRADDALYQAKERGRNQVVTKHARQAA